MKKQARKLRKEKIIMTQEEMIAKLEQIKNIVPEIEKTLAELNFALDFNSQYTKAHSHLGSAQSHAHYLKWCVEMTREELEK
jgi:hypothetical protein